MTVSDEVRHHKWCLEKQSAERDLTFIQLFSSEYNLYTSPAVRYISHPFSFIFEIFAHIGHRAGWIVCASLYRIRPCLLGYHAPAASGVFSARAQRPVPVPLTPAPLRKGSRSVLRFYPMFFATLPACPSEPALRHIAIEASRSASSRSSCLGLGPGLGLGLGRGLRVLAPPARAKAAESAPWERR